MTIQFRRNLMITLALVPGILLGLFAVLLMARVIGMFRVPTAGMSPGVSAGDHVLMERITFLKRKPSLGDIIVFNTDGIASATVPPGQLYIKRVAGEPKDEVRIADGNLYVNEHQVILSNHTGAIKYFSPAGYSPPKTQFSVPPNSYFVLGDNSTNSLDSRYFGTISRDDIRGRICFCYWPPARFGPVK